MTVIKQLRFFNDNPFNLGNESHLQFNITQITTSLITILIVF